MNRLLILDRDGVINHDSDEYIKSPDEWHAIPGSIEAVAKARKAGWKIAIATNQSAIGRGMIDTAMLGRIHDRMRAAVNAAGGDIDMIAFCPHTPSDQCQCRKPRNGLLLQISRQLDMPLEGALLVGDSMRDLLAAQSVGAIPILVRTGKGAETESRLRDRTIAVYDSLADVVKDRIA